VRTTALGLLAALVATALLCSLALVLSPYQLGLSTFVLTFTIAALAQNLLTGYADVPSLGNVVFLAVSAYVCGALLNQAHIGGSPAIVLAVGASGALGAVVGLPALRIAGAYLAIITVALVFAVQEVLAIHDQYLPDQVLTIYQPAWMLDDRRLYVLTAGLVAGSYFVTWNILRARTGRALVALSESPAAAAGSGIDPIRYRLIAFILSGLLSGLAGIIYLYHFQHVSHATFTLDLSLAFLTMVIVGGTRSLGGSFVGAAVIGIVILSPQFLPSKIGSLDVQQGATGLYAVLLLLALRFFPQGIWNVIASSASRVHFKAGETDAPTSPP
jgi:branched-chain amino acid transport system permease protein